MRRVWELCASSPPALPLVMRADWARVSMAACTRRSGGGAGGAVPPTPRTLLTRAFSRSGSSSGIGLGAPGGPLAILHTLREQGAGGTPSSRPPSTLPHPHSLASPRNEKVARKLVRREEQVAVAVEQARRAGEGGGDAARLHAAVAQAEAVSEDARLAVACAEASVVRRRVGWTPGDRVALSQVVVDYARDVVVMSGRLVHGEEAGGVGGATAAPHPSPPTDPEGVLHKLISCLALEVVWRVREELGERGHSLPPTPPPPRHPPSPDWTPAHVLGPLAALALPEWRLLAYAREVLGCACRTISGGDGYDAIDRVLGTGAGGLGGSEEGGIPSPPSILIIPDSTTGVAPVTFAVEVRGGGSPPAPGDLSGSLTSILACLVVTATLPSRYRLVATEEPGEVGLVRVLGRTSVSPNDVGAVCATWRRVFPWDTAHPPPATVQLDVTPLWMTAAEGEG